MMILSMSQESDSNVWDLVKQKNYPYNHISDIEKFIEELTYKEKFHSHLTGKKISDKEYGVFLKAWNKFDMKRIKYYREFYLKYNV